MPSVSVRSCSAFVWKLSSKNLKKIIKQSNNVGVERGVATRRAQIVWPVTVTNFEGFTIGSNFANMWNLANFRPQNLSQSPSS